MKWIGLLLWLSTAGFAQNRAQLSSPDGLALAERIVQLTDATSLTVPGLVRAATPILENLKEDFKSASSQV